LSAWITHIPAFASADYNRLLYLFQDESDPTTYVRYDPQTGLFRVSNQGNSNITLDTPMFVSPGDFMDVWTRAGSNIPTVFAWRLNGGSWNYPRVTDAPLQPFSIAAGMQFLSGPTGLFDGTARQLTCFNVS
jgi:hypothetical protein